MSSSSSLLDAGLVGTALAMPTAVLAIATDMDAYRHPNNTSTTFSRREWLSGSRMGKENARHTTVTSFSKTR